MQYTLRVCVLCSKVSLPYNTDTTQWFRSGRNSSHFIMEQGVKLSVTVHLLFFSLQALQISKVTITKHYISIHLFCKINQEDYLDKFDIACMIADDWAAFSKVTHCWSPIVWFTFTETRCKPSFRFILRWHFFHEIKMVDLLLTSLTQFYAKPSKNNWKFARDCTLLILRLH